MTSIALRLTDSLGSMINGQPDWSPNGKQIAFVSTRRGNREFFLMNADGSDPVAVTAHPATDEAPVWSPNGKQLAFHTDRDGNYEIYVPEVATGDLTRLTTVRAPTSTRTGRRAGSGSPSSVMATSTCSTCARER